MLALFHHLCNGCLCVLLMMLLHLLFIIGGATRGVNGEFASTGVCGVVLVVRCVSMVAF